MTLLVLLLLIAAAVGLLLVERSRLARDRAAIPLLITVTGTRGKSSVTRLLAAVLRASGRRVLAKTTGAEASIVLPDGTERPVRRRGRPSILEQKRVLRLGAEFGVDAAVVEIMSIHAENHDVESRQLLRPQNVLVTNVRADHTGAMGDRREEIASVLALDVPPGAKVFVPSGECLPPFRASVEREGGTVVEVPAGASAALGFDDGAMDFRTFSDNLDLVAATARALGVDDAAIREGVNRARQDAGACAAWRYRLRGTSQKCSAVSAFAANDPESTLCILDRVMAALHATPDRCIGLMSLRADRGDRTLQWADALAGGALDRFARLYLCGLHAPALARRLRRRDRGGRLAVLRRASPAQMMATVLSGSSDDATVVFGFGNFVGMGEALVRHWASSGELLTGGDRGGSA